MRNDAFLFAPKVPITIFWALHIPLGLVVYLGPSILATLHGLGVLVIAVFWAIVSPRVNRVAYAGAYIVGSEVLWRMAGASLFWEFGKYAISLVFLLGILRNKHAKFPVLPTLYFLFLLPAIVPTISSLGMGEARQQISFNLSGPLAITIAAWFFAQLRLDREEIAYLLQSLISPVISIATILLYVTLTTPNIRWINSSNFAASAGFGPNQVSTILGLGFAATILLMITTERLNSSRRGLLIMLALWFLGQGVLTFSRGGILVGSIAAGSAFIYQAAANRERRLRRLIPLVIILILGLYSVFFVLDDFTGGMLETRFTNLSTTNRDVIARADLQAFFDNPVSGVGVGLAKSYRRQFAGITAGAHTEYTRLISEHGAMGILALAILMIALTKNFQQASSGVKVFMVAFAFWALLTMTHSAMRLASVPFTIGLTFAQFETDDKT